MRRPGLALRLAGFLAAIAASCWAQGNVIPLFECEDSFEVSVNILNQQPPRRILTVATFGYFNLLSTAVTAQAGTADNFVLPGNPNRGQPSTFAPGYNPMVFQAFGGAGRDIVWILNVQQAVARQGTRPCSPLPVVPFLVPLPVRLVAGTTAYGVELMRLVWVGQALSPASFSANTNVVEGFWSSGGGMRGNPTTGMTVSNARLTETALVGDVTIVPSPERTNYALAVQLRESERLVATKSMPIEVYNTCPLSVTPAALPSGIVNSVYLPVSLGAIGGTAPYTFELASGALPPGISLGNGALSGIPTAAGTYDFAINGMSSDRCLARQSYSLVIGGPACAQDLTSRLSLTLGGFRQNLATGRWQQTVTLTNNGSLPVGTPLRLALQSLSPNAMLFNASGTTHCAAPMGRPYINVNLGAATSLRPTQSVTVTLEFVNSTPGQAITYSPRVLAGGSSL